MAKRFEKDSYSHRYRYFEKDKGLKEFGKTVKPEVPDGSLMVRSGSYPVNSGKVKLGNVREDFRKSSTANLIRFLSILDPIKDARTRSEVLAVLKYRRLHSQAKPVKKFNGTKRRPSRVHPMPGPKSYSASFKKGLPVPSFSSVSTLEDRLGWVHNDYQGDSK